MAQIIEHSDHDKLYLAYLRGYVLARSGAHIDASLLPSSTESLAAWALGQEHGAAGTPVRNVASVLEALEAMLRDPSVAETDRAMVDGFQTSLANLGGQTSVAIPKPS